MFDKGKLTVRLTSKEIEDTTLELKNVTDGNIPDGASGGLLFDADVLKELPNDKFGQTAWLLKPTHFFLAPSKTQMDTIVVVSPTIKDGGMVFSRDHSFRVFAVKLDGKYYVWLGTAVQLKTK